MTADRWRRFTYSLAERLGKTRAQLLRETTIRELQEWAAHFELEAEAFDAARNDAALEWRARQGLKDLKRRGR